MRFKEILNDWRIIPDQYFEMPDFSDSIYVGSFSVSRYSLDVYKKIVDHTVAFGCKIGDKFICYIGIELWSKQPYAMACNALTKNEYTKNGIATGLIDFIVKKQGYKIFSDFLLSQNGEDLWLSILKYSQCSISIIDLKTGVDYSLNDVGKKLSDGTIILHPKDDNGKKPNLKKGIGEGDQRFVFLLEEFTGLNETIFTKKFGFPLGRKNGILQDYILYGDGMP